MLFKRNIRDFDEFIITNAFGEQDINEDSPYWLISSPYTSNLTAILKSIKSCNRRHDKDGREHFIHMLLIGVTDLPTPEISHPMEYVNMRPYLLK